MSQDLIELHHMWKSQKLFNGNFINFDKLDFHQKQEMTKEYVLHLFSEANSILESINWKMHHKSGMVKVSREDLILEIVDVWKYLLSIGLLWDLTPEEFIQKYDEKSAFVEQRYLQEFQNYSDKELVICDIDGVIGDYPLSFLNYVKSKVVDDGYCFDTDFSSYENVTQLDLYKYLKDIIPYDLLKEYKHQYRSLGLSRQESVLDGSIEFLNSLKSHGYYIVLLTSRPFDRYKSLYLDTYVWLETNKIPFDALLNDDKKRGKVSELLKTSSVKFIIDDDPKILSGLEDITSNCSLYMLSKSYNKNYFKDKESSVIEVNDLNDILKIEGLNEEKI